MKRLEKRFAQKIILVTGIVIICFVLLIILSTLGSKIRTRSIPTGSIELRTDYSKYLVGEIVGFQITNNYNSEVYISNTCPLEPLEVYKYENESWQRIHATSTDSECRAKDRQIILKPNQTTSGNFGRWPSLFDEAGKYRIVVYVDYYNELPYYDFEIIDKPKVPTVSTSNTGNTIPNSQTDTNTNSSISGNTSNDTVKMVDANGGTITVSYNEKSSYITVMAIKPDAGYTYEGGKSGNEIEVVFKRGENENQIQLFLRNGVLLQKTE